MEDELKQIPAPTSDDFKLESVQHVNHRPHPYCIGARHVAHTADNWGGMLTKDAIKDCEKHGIKCGVTGCNLSFEEHVSDKVLFIQALANKDLQSLDGLKDYLMSIGDKLKQLNIDGVAIIEPKGYKQCQEQKEKN